MTPEEMKLTIKKIVGHPSANDNVSSVKSKTSYLGEDKSLETTVCCHLGKT